VTGEKRKIKGERRGLRQPLKWADFRQGVTNEGRRILPAADLWSDCGCR